MLHTATVTAPASNVSSRLDVRPGLGAPASSGGRRNNRPLAEWRKARAVELATQGHTYQQIADELGYANRGTVHRVVQQALQAVQTENVEVLRAVEVDRLDALQRGVWDAATAGHVPATQAAVRIIQARARVLGLLQSGKPKRTRCKQPQTVVLQDNDCRKRGCPDHT